MKLMKISLIVLALLALLLGLSSKQPGAAQAATFYTSTPEKQGVDSAALLQILDQVEADSANIHSILVMRHGAIVLEAYYPPFDRQDKHSLFSSTKSVLSALVGIAVGEGKIGSLDEPVLNYFRDYTIANMSEWKEQITIRHLLNMTSGLDSCDKYYFDTRDLQYSLNLPVLYQPGTVFEYNSCNSVLLSGILQKVTGMTTLAYAQEKLFEPLEINDYYWSSTPDGITRGHAGLMLTPRDMLKFGQLYLQNGVWQGRQVVPAEWVADTYIDVPFGYNYHWWQAGGAIGAYGYAGQIIFVFPQGDLVVVVTARLPYEDQRMYAGGLAWSAFFAIRSDGPIPESPASKALAERVKAIAHPQAQDVPAMSAMAYQVNGKTFNLQENPLGWQSARLSFEEGKAWLAITTTGPIEKQKFAIGLDGLYRQTEQQSVNLSSIPLLPQRVDPNPFEFNFVVGVPIHGSVWMKGAWTGEDTFSLTVQDARDYDRDTLTFRFSPPGVNIGWYSLDVNSTLMTLEGVSD